MSMNDNITKAKNKIRFRFLFILAISLHAVSFFLAPISHIFVSAGDSPFLGGKQIIINEIYHKVVVAFELFLEFFHT